MANNVNIKLVFDNTPFVSPLVKAALAAQVEKTAKAIEKHVHDNMRAPKSGRVYIIGGKAHQASAPGEAPAILTGDLLDSIEAYQENDLTWIVPSEHIQSWWEFGLRGYAARPYFRPAVDAETPAFVQGCKAATKKALNVP